MNVFLSKSFLFAFLPLMLSNCVRSLDRGQNSVCYSDGDCFLGGKEGHCTRAGYCSYADPSCPSGWRYGLNAPSELSNSCVLPGSEDPLSDGQTMDGKNFLRDKGSDQKPGPCGGLDQPCCASSTCQENLVCLRGSCNCMSAVKADENFACAQRANGTVACWGANTNHQLGFDSLTPDQPIPVQISKLVPIAGIDLGAFHSCAWDKGGDAWCWGSNSDGQSGNSPANGDTVQATKIQNLKGVLQLAAGGFHTCARVADQTIWCWGRNSDGQLGTGVTGNPQNAPVKVQGFPSSLGAKNLDLAAGGFHNCVVVDTSVRCWGLNQDGQTGKGSTGLPQSTPIEVSGLSSVTQITAGDWHSCALKADGSIWCWGRNSSGQLGLGHTNTPVLTPSKVLGPHKFVFVVAGDDHTCAIREDRTAWCWGRNDFGQIGNGGSGGNQNIPAQVSSLSDVVYMALGRDHTCALTKEGKLYCWGRNASGQLGTGGNPDISNTPLPALLSCT